MAARSRLSVSIGVLRAEPEKSLKKAVGRHDFRVYQAAQVGVRHGCVIASGQCGRMGPGGIPGSVTYGFQATAGAPAAVGQGQGKVNHGT